MTAITAFFLQIRAIFSNFRERAGETSLLHPLVTPLKANDYVQAQSQEITQSENFHVAIVYAIAVHYVKYVRIRFFSDPYSLVYGQNRSVKTHILAHCMERYFFTSARPRRVHRKILLLMSAVNYSFYLKLSNNKAHRKTSNLKKQFYLRLISFI